MSILKSDCGDPTECLRYFFEYGAPISGEGRFISTYMCDGSPIPSFEGEPVRVAIKGDMDKFASGLWNALNNDNKVSLFVRYISLADGASREIIYNKYAKASEGQND